jgi:ABC-2 type transport system ATP-binding protein
MWEYIKTVNDEGTSIFLTTHYMDEADHLSDRISIIDHGRIVVTGTSYELKNTLGEDLIYLETADLPRTRAILSRMDTVREIREKSRGIVITLDGDGTKILPGIIEGLAGNDIRVSAVNLKKPSMDDVFLHFTGRELRDAGAHKPATAAISAGRR